MTTALTTPQRLTPDIWQMIMNVAPTMHQSRLFGVSSPEQAAAIMLKGYELGMPLAMSFDMIHVIQGKPSLKPQGALALAVHSGELETFEVTDLSDPQGNPTRCRVSGKRRGGMAYTIEVSMDDARRAGLVKPGSGWESWPANMLRWRAIGFFLDVVMPDLGMKHSDEYGASLTPDGDVIWQLEKQPLTFNDLVAQYGFEEVMKAADGALPETQEEIDTIAAKLAEVQP